MVRLHPPQPSYFFEGITIYTIASNLQAYAKVIPATAASIKTIISFLPNILFPLKNENAILPQYYGGFYAVD